jgi:uncharacterized protein YoxC
MASTTNVTVSQLKNWQKEVTQLLDEVDKTLKEITGTVSEFKEEDDIVRPLLRCSNIMTDKFNDLSSGMKLAVEALNGFISFIKKGMEKVQETINDAAKRQR